MTRLTKKPSDEAVPFMRDRTGWCIDGDHKGCPDIVSNQCPTDKCPAHKRGEVYNTSRCPCDCHKE